MNLSDLVNDMVINKPKVSPFMEQQNEQTENINETLTATGSIVDNGNVTITNGNESADIFDPNLHATDSAGNPVRTKSGKFAKKRGRKSTTTNQPVQSQELIDGNAQCKAAAIATVQTIVMLGMIIGDVDEWKAATEELYTMNQAWTDFYIYHGVTQVPPWLGITIATGAYALPRFQRPKTRGRLTILFSWSKGVISRVRKYIWK